MFIVQTREGAVKFSIKKLWQNIDSGHFEGFRMVCKATIDEINEVDNEVFFSIYLSLFKSDLTERQRETDRQTY